MKSVLTGRMANIRTVIMTIQVLLFSSNSKCYPVPNGYFSLGINYPTKPLFDKLLIPVADFHRTIQKAHNEGRSNFRELVDIPLHKIKHPWIISKDEISEAKSIGFNGQTFFPSDHKNIIEKKFKEISSDTISTSSFNTKTQSTESFFTEELSTYRNENSDFKNLNTNVIIKSRLNLELTTDATFTKGTMTTLTSNGVTETTVEGETTAALDDIIETRVGPQVVASLLG